ncbi:MAG: hypothetical protein QXN32_06700, partial [Candidatus Nitrosocaldus sp.]
DSSNSSGSGRLGSRSKLSSSSALIAGSIITSSLLISSAIIMESNPTLGQIGFAAAAVVIGAIMIARKV